MAHKRASWRWWQHGRSRDGMGRARQASRVGPRGGHLQGRDRAIRATPRGTRAEAGNRWATPHRARGRARPGRTARIERCSAVCAMSHTRAPTGLGGVPPTRTPHTLRRPCAAARSGEIVETCRRSSARTNTSPTTFDRRTQIVTLDNPACALQTTCARDDGNPKKGRSRFDILATLSQPVADGLGAKIVELGEGSHASCAGSRSVCPSPIPAGGTSVGTRSTSCRGAAPRRSGSPTTGSPR